MGSTIGLVRASEFEHLRAIVDGRPFRYQLTKWGGLLAEGQVIGNTGNVVVDFSRPQEVAGLADAIQVSAGPRPCALLRGGRLLCFEDMLTYDTFGDNDGFRRSGFFKIEDAGVKKVSGRGLGYYLKQRRVWRVDFRDRSDGHAVPAGSTAIPLEDVDDFCAAGGGQVTTTIVCGSIRGELVCWGEITPQSDFAHDTTDQLTSQATRRPIPGVQVASLDCNYGGVDLLATDGTIWVSVGRVASWFLRPLQGFPKAIDYITYPGLICAIDIQGALYCCGTYEGDAPQIGTGSLYDASCRPIRVDAS